MSHSTLVEVDELKSMESQELLDLLKVPKRWVSILHDFFLRQVVGWILRVLHAKSNRLLIGVGLGRLQP